MRARGDITSRKGLVYSDVDRHRDTGDDRGDTAPREREGRPYPRALLSEAGGADGGGHLRRLL